MKKTIEVCWTSHFQGLRECCLTIPASSQEFYSPALLHLLSYFLYCCFCLSLHRFEMKLTTFSGFHNHYQFFTSLIVLRGRHQIKSNNIARHLSPSSSFLAIPLPLMSSRIPKFFTYSMQNSPLQSFSTKYHEGLGIKVLWETESWLWRVGS